MVKFWPVRVKVRSGSESRVLHSTVYCPLKPFLAPISLFLRSQMLVARKRRGTNSNLQKVSKSAWEDNKRSSGIEDSTSIVHLSSLLAKSDGVKVNLPVSLAAEGKLGDLAGIMRRVNAAKDGLRLLLASGSKVKGKNGIIQKPLVDHVVEWRGDSVDGDGIIAQSQNAIEPAESKSKPRLIGSLSKELILDFQVADCHGIPRNKAAELSGAVLDLKFRAVLLVGARGFMIIFAVEVARNGAALGRWNPEVGAAGVHDNLEFLWRATDRDGGEVLMG